MTGTGNKKRPRPGVKKKTDIPPDFDIRRETPRSLSQTLRVIRLKGANHALEEMAARLQIKSSTLRRWERPYTIETEISLRDLQRFQDLLGIPNSLIHAISQIFATDAPRCLKYSPSCLASLPNASVRRRRAPPPSTWCSAPARAAGARQIRSTATGTICSMS